MKNPFTHYPYSHATLSLVIGIPTALIVHYLTGIPLLTWWLWIWGGVFYAIREVIQWRQKDHWDNRGFWWGVIPSVALALIVTAV